MANVFAPINRHSLKDVVANSLREAIFSGKMTPGQRVVEMEVSRQMRVAQSAVREALQELEFQSLVAKVPNKGTFVANVSFQDINEIFTVRRELESLAVFLAREAGRPHEDDVAEFEQIIHGMRLAADRKEYPRFTRYDLEFHAKLWHLSGNRTLERALRMIVTPHFFHTLSLYPRHGDSAGPLFPTDLRPLVDKHGEILEYLKAHDAAACRQYMAQVIDDLWQQSVHRTKEVRG